MPRTVPIAKQHEIVEMMFAKDENGKSLYGQREIEQLTGISRPFLRKLAKSIGFQFERNGIEVVGQITCCSNCGIFFRRPKSKIERAKKPFCDVYCKEEYMKGSLHSNWKDGGSSDTFSKFIKNQAGYQEWRERALERAGNKCEITGVTEDLSVHHIKPKKDFHELALEDSNSFVVSGVAHRMIHKFINEGYDYEKAIEKTKEHFSKKEA